MKKLLSVIMVFAIVCSFSPPVFAAGPTTRNWSGLSSVDSNWQTAANWDTTPVANNALNFTGSTRTSPQNDFAANTQFDDISFDNNASASFNVGGNAINLSGGITNNSNALLQTISLDMALQGDTNVNSATGDLTLNGIISGAFGLIKAGADILTLTKANTYTGKTAILAGTLSAASLGDVGGAASNLGIPGNAADGTISLGNAGTAGQLTYTGAGETTDRVIDLAGTTGGVTIDAAGTGLLKFTSAFTATGAGSKTLTLTDAVLSGGEIAGAIVDNNTLGGNLTSVTKDGGGTWTLSGANTFTGGVTVNQGTLKVGFGNAFGPNNASVTAVTVKSGGAVDFNGIVNAVCGYTIAGTGVGGTGALVNTGVAIPEGAAQCSNIKLSADATIGGTGDWQLLTAGWGATTLDLNNFTLTKAGANTVTLCNTTIQTGTILVDNGIIALNANHGTVDGSLANFVLSDTAGATLDLKGKNLTIASLQGGGTTGGEVKLGVGTLTVGDATSTVYSGIISNVGGGSLIKQGTGTLALNGTNTYTGGTTITTGTLKVGNANALGTGNIAHNATLDIGLTTLNVGGTYIQGGASTLMVDVNGTANGSIVATGKATVTATDSLVLAVTNYVPDKAAYTIIDGALGGLVAAPIITDNSSIITFAATTVGDDLILTASRAANAYSGEATNGNGAAVGAALDSITNPTGDMLTVMNALDNLTPSEVATSEDSMTPTVDGGVTQSSTQMLSQFINNVVSHLENMQAPGGATGVSTGEDYLKGVEIWAQGLGDYAHQDSRGSSNGYNATTWGLSGGADMAVYNDSNRIGLGSGYGQTFVRSKDFAGKTDIDSIPAIAYYSYEGTDYPVYFDAAFTFVYNSYSGSRQVSAGTAERTANADYNGQQYSGYFEGGYSFFYKSLRMTPLVSFQYMHLYTGSYTETGAGALNLSVGSQDYDMAQTGFGAKIAYPFRQKWGDITPELHAKWLYDWVGDAQATTASFAGGGTAFGTQGFEPAQSGYDFGTKITFKSKCNISIGLDYDFLFKDDYYEHTGIMDVKYSF